MMKILGGKGSAALIALCAHLLIPSAASAQNEAHVDPRVDLQLFDYAVGPKSFMSVVDGDTWGKGQFSVDMLLTYLTDPFVIYTVTPTQDDIESERSGVVTDLFAGQLIGAYGLTDKLQLGLVLPMVFSMSGDGVDPSTGRMSGDAIQATGLGDLRAEVKGQIFQNQVLRTAWWGGISIPTSYGSDGNDYFGDSLPSIRGGGAAQYVASKMFTLGANAGVMLRKPRDIYDTRVGQQLFYGVGGAVNPTDRFSVIAELFGRTGFEDFAKADNSPVEAGGGLRLKATKSIFVTAGGGAGLVSGVGAPTLRVLASVGYAPDFRDTDGDGIANQNDRCPLLAEDVDEFEDRDGCPDDDNDGDKREDSLDKCPMDREDLDGFEDDDGCPEDDNDKDGIKDFDDRCPNDAEDKLAPYQDDGCPANMRDSDDDGVSDDKDKCPDDYEDEDGFEDWDGCPEEDNDRDGLADEDDTCPLCPEDKDSFDDADGCPDLDNDRDGLADREDQCPDEPETLNGNGDSDGCPDSGSELASLEGNRVVLSGNIGFRRTRLRSSSTVDALGRLMQAHDEVLKWRIVVAVKNRGNEEAARQEAQGRADSLKGKLQSLGVSSDRVEAIGAVSDNEVVAVAVIERAETDSQEYMCPEWLRVKPREPSAASTAAGMVDGDSDGDGVVDMRDRCRKKAGPVENWGCPDSDLDGDTVVDRIDNCPDEPGTPENHGCEEEQLVVLTRDRIEILDKVFFATGKARIRSRSNALLKNVARVLNSHPEIKKVEIGGHTDDQGNDDKNLKLSQERAESVLAFLVKEGVSADRLTARGYGETKPAVEGTDKDAREANRRVEFNVVHDQ